MKNDKIINIEEGQEVASLNWPFYRYNVLIPEKQSGDLFVWFFLSLVVYFNETRNLVKNTYSEEVEKDVISFLNKNFSTVIDNETVKKIINNVEEEYLTKNKNEPRILEENTFKFLESYDSLFSENLYADIIYQDAITGEVVPLFENNFSDDIFENTGEGLSPRSSIKEPSIKSVRKAYQQYNKNKKNITKSNEQEVELEDEFYEYDELGYANEISSDKDLERQKNKNINIDNYNVVFIKDKKSLFNLEVKVFVLDNEIKVKSPFGDGTNKWMEKCFKKARNVSNELDMKVKEIEELYLIKETEIKKFFESNKQDFATSLYVLQSLYRIIDSLNDDKLRLYVINMDQKLKEQDLMFYIYCGKFLERLLKKIKYQNKTEGYQRLQTDFVMFCKEIDYKFLNKSINYDRLKSRKIHNDWLKKYSKKDGEEFISFKADLTDILLRTNLINVDLMYPTFIDEIFNIYDLRNANSHDNDEKIYMDDLLVNKITKIVKVLFELI